ncbi:MAG TPA: SDR family oxidoreductase [Vicinamibacterales bacterium]|nr:SDR family oxidoreductase [Vicinamibacterales bacterium]
MNRTLEGRVVAITGASAGIGLACAARFAGEGASVALSARRGEKIAALAEELTAAGARAIAVPGDVTNDADVQALVDRAVETFGRLDVMVANAGAGYHGTLEDTPPDVARRLMDVNFIGTYLAARAAMRVFTRQGSGHLIVISSIVGRRGIAGSAVYGATKAAQLGFAESLRTEYLGTGIDVTVVFPVATETEFHSAMRRDYGVAVEGLGPTQSADTVAAAIHAAILKPRPEVYPHATSRALAVLGVVAPRFTDRLVRKYARRRKPAAKVPPERA